jgi:hypothetical protein
VVITDQAKKRQAGRLLAVVSTLQLHHELMRAQTRVALYGARASLRPMMVEIPTKILHFKRTQRASRDNTLRMQILALDKNTFGRKEPARLQEKLTSRAGIMT